MWSRSLETWWNSIFFYFFSSFEMYLVQKIVNRCHCVFEIQKEAENLRMRLISHSVPGTHRGKMCFCVALQHNGHHIGSLLTPQKCWGRSLIDTWKCFLLMTPQTLLTPWKQYGCRHVSLMTPQCKCKQCKLLEYRKWLIEPFFRRVEVVWKKYCSIS